ncbi:PE family protein, partial [Mycobacterium intermedium]
MSYVVAAPELLSAAAENLAALHSALGVANATAEPLVTNLVSAAADEVSTGIAKLFALHAAEYQAISVQASLFHGQFVQVLTGGAVVYAAAEAASASPLQSLEQSLLALINAPTNALLGR